MILGSLTFDNVNVLYSALSVSIENQNQFFSSGGVSLVVKILVYNTTLNGKISSNSKLSPLSFDIFIPPILTFSSTSPSKIDLTYLPISPGTYQINISSTIINSNSNNNYNLFPNIILSKGNTFVVRKINQPQPPPSISTSKFSSDGSKVTIIFTSSTNKGGISPPSSSSSSTSNVVDCSKLFFPTLFSLTRCVWVDDKSLDVYSTGDSGLKVEDKLRLRGGILKARCLVSNSDCFDWKWNDPQNITISEPDISKSPEVKLSTSNKIGLCDNLFVDISGSTGSGGRSWKSISISISLPNEIKSNLVNVSGFDKYLFELNSNLKNNHLFWSSSIEIPRSLLNTNSNSKINYNLNISVKMCNFLNSCGWKNSR